MILLYLGQGSAGEGSLALVDEGAHAFDLVGVGLELQVEQAGEGLAGFGHHMDGYSNSCQDTHA